MNLRLMTLTYDRNDKIIRVGDSVTPLSSGFRRCYDNIIDFLKPSKWSKDNWIDRGIKCKIVNLCEEDEPHGIFIGRSVHYTYALIEHDNKQMLIHATNVELFDDSIDAVVQFLQSILSKISKDWKYLNSYMSKEFNYSTEHSYDLAKFLKQHPKILKVFVLDHAPDLASTIDSFVSEK